MNIGNTIRRLRKKKGINQIEFASKCNLSQTYLSQIESGKRIPTIETLNKISENLDIPMAIISFLSLNLESVAENKRDAYLKISPAINAMVEEFFLQN